MVTLASVSGQAIPAVDKPHWRVIFAEDFATDVPVGGFPDLGGYSAKWFTYRDWWRDTTKNGLYAAHRVLSVQNHCLNYHLHTEDGVHLVAAARPLINPGGAPLGQLYGRYTVRFRVTPKTNNLRGYKTAWLLWPDSEVWPRDGEVDFPEGDLDNLIHGYLHLQDATLSNDQDAYNSQVLYSNPARWHTATTIWSPGCMEFYLDSVLVGKSTARVPTTPMHYVLQTETSTWGVVPADDTEGTIEVDWVVIYAYVP